MDDINRNDIYFSILIAVFFFLFIALLTYNIPFFWEDTLFMSGVMTTPYTQLMSDTFRVGTENFSHPGIPLTIVVLKSIAELSGFNIIWFRIHRALLFSLSLVLLFFFFRYFSIEKKQAFIMVFFIGLSYPLFLMNFFILRPELLGLPFKVGGLILFFYVFFHHDIFSLKKVYGLLTVCFILFFIAMKFDSPMYFIGPTILCFILCVEYKKIITYMPFLVLLFSVYFPLKTSILHGDVGMYNLSLTNLNHMFQLNNFWFIFPLNNLYYKTLPEIFTIFGVVVVISVIGILGTWFFMKLFKKSSIFFYEETAFNKLEKMFMLFMLLDFIFNLLIIIAAPEPATRYMVFFIIPLFSLFLFLLFKFYEVLQSPFKKIIIVCFILLSIMVIYNVTLSLLFRFSWGSGFIGMDNVASYFDKLPTHSTVIYFAGSVADEYAPLKIENNTFVSKTNVLFVKKTVGSEITEKEIEEYKQDGNNIYFVRRVTSSGTEFPPLESIDVSKLTLATVIYGENSFIDALFLQVTKIMQISYAYNTFYVYEHH